MSPFSRFVTLMQREWMQHRTGWLVLMIGPSLVMALLSLLDGGALQIRIGEDSERLPALQDLSPVLQTLGWTVATVTITQVVVAMTVLFQLPDLARRDQKDRSVEFWRSLPIGHSQAVGATVLMHLLVLPGAAVAAAVLGAQAAAALSLISANGAMAWLQQPWWHLLPVMLLALLRAWLGLVLAVAWLSPLLLLTMAAAAWLKRWALPAVGALLGLGLLWLDPRLPWPVVKTTLLHLGHEALNAMLALHTLDRLRSAPAADLQAVLPDLPRLLSSDGLAALNQAASPAFAAALAGGALGFALLVLRRQRAD